MAGKTRMKSPNRNRRKTLGPVPNSSSKSSRENVVGVDIAPAKGGKKKRPPRASMLPRMGRENAPPAAAAAGSDHSPGRAPAGSLNRRQSVGGAGLEKKQQRRQSVIPQPTASTIARDPRNINDKAFQQQSMKRLLNHLLERGYDQPISMKTLKMPSGKDFVSITTFMLRRIDPNFQRGDAKFEDEVSSTLKSIGYPFPVSKTALVSAGSPHTWPHLLAVLAWLMETSERIDSCALPSDERTRNEGETTVYESVDDLEEGLDKVFFRFLAATYEAFLLDDPDAKDQMENILFEQIERDEEYIAQEIERVTDVNTAIVQRINDGKDQSEEIKEWIQKKEDYQSQIEQFEDLFKQYVQIGDAFAQKLEKGMKDLDAKNEEIERTEKSLQSLKKRIEEQELSIDDAKKLEIEKKTLEEALDRVWKKREGLKATQSKSEEGLAKVAAQVDAAVAEYNTSITEMSVVPIIGPIYSELKADLKKDGYDGNQEQFIGVDLRGKVQQSIDSHHPELVRRTEDKTADNEDALDALQKREHELNESSVKVKILKEENVKFEETLEQERAAQATKVSVRQREVDAMREKVETLRDPVALEEEMAGLERQCVELEAMRIKHKEENIARKQACQKEIADACSLMQEHDMFVRSTTAGVKDYRAQTSESLRKLVPPQNINSDVY